MTANLLPWASFKNKLFKIRSKGYFICTIPELWKLAETRWLNGDEFNALSHNERTLFLTEVHPALGSNT